jgi:3-phenylpropionate/trans-cinnamate dioxygenase ferredoxin reductase subunit
VRYLRSLDDSNRLRDVIRGASRVAVIGAGWIGSEVAASARQMGADVVLIDPSAVPLRRVLGDVVGEAFRRLHADHGVRLRLGVGVTPRTAVAGAAGLAIDDGIVVDQHLETSVPGIYAAGDVASAWHPHYRRHVRVEHWANALNQGTTAGKNAAAGQEVYDRLPYFFSDQYDLGMEYVGLSDPGDEVVVRGDLDARRFVAFWHRDGVVTAAMNVNVWDVIEDLKAIVAAKRRVDLGRLTDEDVALGDVVGASTG